MLERLKETILIRLDNFSKLPFVLVLQKTFVSFSGLLLVSSLLTLIQKFPIDNWEKIIGVKTIELITKISNIGFNYISIFVIIAFTFYYIESHNLRTKLKINHIPIVLLNVALFISINYPYTEKINNATVSLINLKYFGASGVFGALILSYLSIKIYIWFLENKICIKLPKEVPDIIADSFLSIIPTLLIILFWWIISYVLQINILNIIELIFSPLMKLGDSFLAALLIPLFNRILWFVGIHGASVINSIISPITTIMNTANLQAFNQGEVLPYFVSGNFYSNYVWIGLFPLTLALITTKSKKLKTIGIASIIPGLFNIDEPLLFGVPIILNPILIIPHILTGIIPGVLSYFAMKIGLIPIPVLNLPWTIPAPIKAFLATNNDWRALLWVLLLWVIMYFIYLPFLKKMEKN